MSPLSGAHSCRERSAVTRHPRESSGAGRSALAFPTSSSGGIPPFPEIFLPGAGMSRAALEPAIPNPSLPLSSSRWVWSEIPAPGSELAPLGARGWKGPARQGKAGKDRNKRGGGGEGGTEARKGRGSRGFPRARPRLQSRGGQECRDPLGMAGAEPLPVDSDGVGEGSPGMAGEGSSGMASEESSGMAGERSLGMASEGSSGMAGEGSSGMPAVGSLSWFPALAPCPSFPAPSRSFLVFPSARSSQRILPVIPGAVPAPAS